VREPVSSPLCGFYAAAFARLLLLFDVRAKTEVVACRGTGERTCLLKVAMVDGGESEQAIEAGVKDTRTHPSHGTA
jgi:hypothetical protein